VRTGGTIALAAPAQSLWSRLSDPRMLEDALPAVELVELIDSERFTVGVAPATGLGITPLRLELSIKDAREPEHVRLEGTGHAAEMATAFGVDLDFDSRGQQTTVRWSAEARFDGVLSSVGQRVLPAIFAAQVERVLKAAAEPVAQPA
jgi:carbon monoxide dehydrogenase subunit G